MLELLVSVLILALVVVIIFYVIDLIVPGNIAQIAKLIVGLIALIYLLAMVLPMLKGGALKLGALDPPAIVELYKVA
jgi:hypothetical protein